MSRPLRPGVPGPEPEPDQPPDGAANAEPTTAEAEPDGRTEPASTRLTRRIRVPFARAVPRVRPRQAVRLAGRATREWSRRPAGRITLPALLLLTLVLVSGAAGAVLVPATAGEPHPARVAATPAERDPAAGQPTPGVSPPPAPLPPQPTNGLPGGPPVAPGGRPADVLAGWAQQTSARTGVPAVALQAYGYAELVLAQTTPSCRLTWTTLAAIGLVESNHGQANGNTLGPDGRSTPGIVGLPLDGAGGRQRIVDTDGGQLDGDRVYDRAVGPMQFIPTTWRENAIDADNDGARDPQDIDDAALAAGNYLCRGGRDLSTAQDWWRAILSYNDVRRYAQEVYDAANRYGTASRA